MAFRITVQQGVRIDASLYALHVGMFCQVMRKTVAEVVKNEARLLARDACDLYPPFSGSEPQITKGGEGGFGLRARNKGRAAVNRDIRRIFAPLDQAPAGLVAKRGDIGIFYAWIEAKMEKPAPHYPTWLFDMFKQGAPIHSQRPYELFIEARHGNFSGKGHILQNESESQIGLIHRSIRGMPSYKVNKNRKPDFYIQDWNMVEKYIKKTQERVGKLKSGWWHAGKALGKMPQAMWISDQPSKYAICDQMLAGPNPKVRIGNSIGKLYSQGWHLFQKAWNHRGYAMRVKMLQALSGSKNHQTLLELTQKLKGFDVTKLP